MTESEEVSVKEKETRQSIMDDIYNDLSSDDDDEEAEIE
jgi:hypothetical protein